MGCFDSKMDSKRKALADDWTGSDYAFGVGGIATFEEFCPLDKLVVKFCGGEGKEIAAGLGEVTDHKLAEDKAKELGGKIFEALKKLHEEYKGGKDDGNDSDNINVNDNATLEAADDINLSVDDSPSEALIQTSARCNYL